MARVIHYIPYGSWHVHNQVDCVIGAALRVRGTDVVAVGCDGLFKDRCYVLAHSKNPDLDCANCAANGRALPASLGIPLLQLREYMHPTDADAVRHLVDQLDPENYPSAVVEGLPIGEWVRPSVRSFYVLNPRNLHLPEARALYKIYFNYTLQTFLAAERLCAAYQPTHVTMFGGYGFLHAPMYYVANQRGCRIVTHERGALPSRFMVAADDPVDAWRAISPVLDAWDPVPLVDDEVTEIRSVLDDWEVGKNRNVAAFYSSNTDASMARQRLGIPSNARIFAVFTSGEHEFSTPQEREMGGRQMEIIDTLIDLFRDREEYLVVRHHPGVGNTARSRLDYNYLTRALRGVGKLPHNVRIVLPNEQVTSYALLWNTEACFAFLSTIGLEALARGVPCASFAISGFARAMNVVLQTGDRDELRGALDQLLRCDESAKIRGMRGAFAFLRAQQLRYAVRFRTIGIKGTHEPNILLTSVDQLREGYDVSLDRICNFFSKGSTIYDLPSDADARRSRYVEEVALAAEYKRLAVLRAEIQNRSKDISRTVVDSVAVIYESANSREIPEAGIMNQRGVVMAPQACANLRDIELLLQGLQNCSHELIALHSPGVRHTEAFISSLQPRLESTKGAAGVIGGGWLLTSAGEVYGHLLTQGVDALSAIVQRAGRGILWHELLSWGLFRRDGLVQILHALRSVAEPERTTTLLKTIDNRTISHLGVPLVCWAPQGGSSI